MRKLIQMLAFGLFLFLGLIDQAIQHGVAVGGLVALALLGILVGDYGFVPLALACVGPAFVQKGLVTLGLNAEGSGTAEKKQDNFA